MEWIKFDIDDKRLVDGCFYIGVFGATHYQTCVFRLYEKKGYRRFAAIPGEIGLRRGYPRYWMPLPELPKE